MSPQKMSRSPAKVVEALLSVLEQNYERCKPEAHAGSVAVTFARVHGLTAPCARDVERRLVPPFLAPRVRRRAVARFPTPAASRRPDHGGAWTVGVGEERLVP